MSVGTPRVLHALRGIYRCRMAAQSNSDPSSTLCNSGRLSWCIDAKRGLSGEYWGIRRRRGLKRDQTAGPSANGKMGTHFCAKRLSAFLHGMTHATHEYLFGVPSPLPRSLPALCSATQACRLSCMPCVHLKHLSLLHGEVSLGPRRSTKSKSHGRGRPLLFLLARAIMPCGCVATKRY